MGSDELISLEKLLTGPPRHLNTALGARRRKGSRKRLLTRVNLLSP
jgi:hypothetical protein